MSLSDLNFDSIVALAILGIAVASWRLIVLGVWAVKAIRKRRAKAIVNTRFMVVK